MKSIKDTVIQTFQDAHTQEDAPRATPNYLEASFKSNKRESKDENILSAFKMNLVALSLKMVEPHTSILLSLNPYLK
jgi:hypothetical protein